MAEGDRTSYFFTEVNFLLVDPGPGPDPLLLSCPSRVPLRGNLGCVRGGEGARLSLGARSPTGNRMPIHTFELMKHKHPGT